MTNIDFTEVVCPITRVTFPIVRNELPDNIELLSQWANDLVQRGNSGKNINIAIDCEGYNLGTRPNSLGLIQIGEIFNDNFSARQIAKKQKNLKQIAIPNIGPKSGFLIMTPLSPEVKDSLNKVLKHKNVTIFTFDFTADFASMIEQGIEINLKNVFDSQLLHSTKPKSLITFARPQPLRWFVNQAATMDPSGRKAKQFIDHTKKNFFCLQHFFLNDSPHPAQDMVTANTLKIGITDVYFTGLAAVYCMKQGKTGLIHFLSLRKVKDFNRFITKNNGKVLAPPCIRQTAFFNLYKIKKFNNGDIDLSAETDEDLMKLATIFSETATLIDIHAILQENYQCKLPIEEANRLYSAVLPILNANISRLRQMLTTIEQSSGSSESSDVDVSENSDE